MATDSTNEALLDYLKGERDVMLAAAVVCDVATRSWVDCAALVEAMELLLYTLAAAGIAERNWLEVSSDLMFAHHHLCEIDGVQHYSVEGLEAMHDAC